MSVGGPVADGSMSIEPGTALVACLPGPRTAYWDVEFATFHLVDPEGLWLTSGVDCDETSTIDGQLGTAYRSIPDPQLPTHLEEAIGGRYPTTCSARSAIRMDRDQS